MSAQPTSSGPSPGYEIIIEPSRGWLRVNWREFWEYRDLLGILVRRDFLAKYKQTVLGPLWFIVQPLLMALVFSVAFNNVAGVQTGDVPPFLFNLCALLTWGYFSQNVTTGAATFTANSHLFGKVYFPRLIVPVAAVVSNLFALLLQFGVFLVFFAWYSLRGEEVSMAGVLLLLPIMAVAAIFSLGLSLLISASTARYRDLAHLTPVVIQLWMFATPVFYPMERLLTHEKLWWLAWVNPMAPLVEGTRYALLGHGVFHAGMFALSAFFSIAALVLGIAAFNRAERTVVDTV